LKNYQNKKEVRCLYQKSKFVVDDQKEHMLQLIARSKELRDLMKKSQIAPEEEETLAEPPKTQDLSTVANRIFNSK
jgi:hypothetical protein